MAGVARGVVLTYDLATQAYREVGPGTVAIWLPDGRLGWLTENSLTVIDLGTGTRTPATFFGRPPNWSSFSVRPSGDGRMLYFVLNENESDVWIADLSGGRSSR
jgi:hypothetical protein